MDWNAMDFIASMTVDADADGAPIEIQLMRMIRAMREKLGETTLSADDREFIEQKLRDTELRLAVVHERNGHASLANPDRIR